MTDVITADQLACVVDRVATGSGTTCGLGPEFLRAEKDILQQVSLEKRSVAQPWLPWSRPLVAGQMSP